MNTIDHKKIGSNIKRLIKESHFKTQANFALACGKGIRTVGHWVQDGVDNTKIINLIVETLKVDVMDILF